MLTFECLVLNTSQVLTQFDSRTTSEADILSLQMSKPVLMEFK